MVDFALVVPPLLALTFAIIEYGRFFWAQEALEQTALAAARCMGIHQSSCASGGAYSASATQTFIANTASSWGISVPTANMTLNNSATCAGTSGFSSVTLTTNFVTAVPGLLPLPSGGTTLTASACFPNNS
ncbi:MAG TPA: TadE/TadG family type IV pilus assembly protein [Candidatus Margulisiibacteriota bacterium]|nr:TadE/TadG family type IV pilus assembly protein [Candidatus Margulisiibacteriota bacterium]